MSTTDSPKAPSKVEVMRALLEHAEAQVHLDARRPGVLLPPRLLASGNVRLDYGYGLVPPIYDLSLDDNGISATLSFGSTSFPTFVPWTAVFLIADFAGRGAVWREDLPSELVNQVDIEPSELQKEEPAPAPRRFTVLDGDAGPALSTPSTETARPALRLVK